MTDQNISSKSADNNKAGFDYAFVETIARIAVYDDLRSAPRVIKIQPATTAEFIENLASKIYEQAKIAGGTIPYTVIREVSENFIHAKFAEIIVSILDQGKTIRFSDQGPGIARKDKAQLPGFTSAIEPMKRYIRGVGSGLPIVKDYLDFSNGTITIEDNLECGSVVTVSLTPQANSQRPPKVESLTPPLNQREKDLLPFFLHEGALGVTDLVNLTGLPQSSTYVALKKLEEYGLVEKTVNQKRMLTDLGYQVANSL